MIRSLSPNTIFLGTLALAGCFSGAYYLARPAAPVMKEQPNVAEISTEEAAATTQGLATLGSSTQATQTVGQSNAYGNIPPAVPLGTLGERQSSRGGEAAPHFPNAKPNTTEAVKTAGPQPTTLTVQQMAERAARVENEANRELERLIPLLNLTQAQQDQVFDRLAQNSVDWHPGFQFAAAGGGTPTQGPAVLGATGGSGNTSMGTGTGLSSGTGSGLATGLGASSGNGGTNGSPTTTATGVVQPIQEVILPPAQSISDILTSPKDPILTDEQEEVLQNDVLDRQEWWSEMVDVMKTNMDGKPTTTPETAPPPVENFDKTVEGADTVVD